MVSLIDQEVAREETESSEMLDVSDWRGIGQEVLTQHILYISFFCRFTLTARFQGGLHRASSFFSDLTISVFSAEEKGRFYREAVLHETFSEWKLTSCLSGRQDFHANK